jgi:hypothetical protein
VQKRLTAGFVGVALAVLGTIGSGAQTQSKDPWIGTWKTNLEKSTYSPGPKPTTATTITVESAAGGGMKTTFDGTTSEGKPFHTEVVGAFDGKDNPVKGAQFPNTSAAYKRIDSRTFESMTKIDGKPTTTSRIVISADGKTLTATTTGKTVKGETVNNVVVADKQ